MLGIHEEIDYKVLGLTIAKYYGYNQAIFMRCGDYGCTFDVGDNKVLKLTLDRNEALNANSLRQKPVTKHLMNYYDVRVVEDYPFENRTTYAIIMDKITPLSDLNNYKHMQMAWNLLRKHYFDRSISDNDFYSASNAFKITNNDFKKAFNAFLKQRSGVIKEFYKYNIPSTDCHFYNIGIKDGKFVFFDLGLLTNKKDRKILKTIPYEYVINGINDFNEKNPFKLKNEHIYNNINDNKNRNNNMKKIKLTERDLTNIVSKIVNEASNPRIERTAEPPSRNTGGLGRAPKGNFTKPDMYEERKEMTQNVLDRIMKYGNVYLRELRKLNREFPIKADRFGRYSFDDIDGVEV